MAAQKSPSPQIGFLEKYESAISTFFGFLVVLIIGSAFLFFLRKLPMTKAPSLLDFGAQTTAENLITPKQSPTPVQQPITAPSAGSTYQVRSGDTLWTIAERSLGSGYRWKEIAAANGIADRTIKAGQKLTIPSTSPVVKAPKQTQTKTSVTTVKTTKNPDHETHTVKRGENLWKIAVVEYNNGYKWLEIYRANKRAIGSNPGLIRVGMQLTLPKVL